MISDIQSVIFDILRLVFLLLTPLWLSLGVESLGGRLNLAGMLPVRMESPPTSDPAGRPPAPPPQPAPPPMAAIPASSDPAPPDPVAADRAVMDRSGTGRPASIPAEPVPTVETPPAAPLPQPLPPAPLQPAGKPEPPANPAMEPAILVSGIRTGGGGEAIRVVLDLDRPPRFDPPVRMPGGSLSVTLPGTAWKAMTSGKVAGGSLIYRVESSGDLSRLVLSAGNGPKGGRGAAPVPMLKAIFAMSPDNDHGHRLVIDLTLPAADKAGQGGKPQRTGALASGSGTLS